jgi:hypothetical protein
MRTLLITLCSSLFFAFAGSALAEEGSVCDAQIGAALGLCNAYHEGMECGTDNQQASETACDRVSDRFLQITGDDMPSYEPQIVAIWSVTITSGWPQTTVLTLYSDYTCGWQISSPDCFYSEETTGLKWTPYPNNGAAYYQETSVGEMAGNIYYSDGNPTGSWTAVIIAP